MLPTGHIYVLYYAVESNEKLGTKIYFGVSVFSEPYQYLQNYYFV